jgi:hypothetical protein
MSRSNLIRSTYENYLTKLTLFECSKSGIQEIEKTIFKGGDQMTVPIIFGSHGEGKTSLGYLFLVYSLVRGLYTEVIHVCMNPYPKRHRHAASTPGNEETISDTTSTYSDDLKQAFDAITKDQEIEESRNRLYIIDQVELADEHIMVEMEVFVSRVKYNAELVGSTCHVLLISSGGMPPCPSLLKIITAPNIQNCVFDLFAIKNFLTEDEKKKFPKLDPKIAGLDFRLSCLDPTVQRVTNVEAETKKMSEAITGHVGMNIAIKLLHLIVSKEYKTIEITLWTGKTDESFYKSVICLKPILERATIVDKNYANWNKTTPFHRIDPPLTKKNMKLEDPPFCILLSEKNAQVLSDLLSKGEVFVKLFQNQMQTYAAGEQDGRKGTYFEYMFYTELLFRSYMFSHPVGLKFIFDADKQKSENTAIVTGFNYHHCTLLQCDLVKPDPESMTEPKGIIPNFPPCNQCTNTDRVSHKVCYSLMTNVIKRNYPSWDYMHIETEHDFGVITVLQLQLVQITIAEKLLQTHPIDTLANSAVKLKDCFSMDPNNIYIIYAANPGQRSTGLPPKHFSDDKGNRQGWCVTVDIDPKDYRIFEMSCAKRTLS